MPTNEKSKSLNLQDIKPENTFESTDNEVFQTLLIEDVKYKTRLTKKYLNRKPYVPVDPKRVFAFIPGTIKKIYTAKGKKIKAGEKLVDLEAMKMLNTIFADQNGTIADIYIKEGDLVSKNHLLMLFK
jgi:biotin carboxyl carrier protein